MAVAASAGYTKIFPLKGTVPRPGYWLVSKNGHGAIVNQHHLPAEGQGFKYYWLGSDAAHANGKLLDALAKLKVSFDPARHRLDVRQADKAPYEIPDPKKGLAGLLAGVDLIPLPGVAGGAAAATATSAETPLAGAAAGAETGAAGAAAGAETGAATGAETGAATGAETGAATGAAATLAADAGVASLISFIADPKLWLRVVEIVGGVILLAMGLRALTGGAVDPFAPARAAAKVATVA